MPYSPATYSGANLYAQTFGTASTSGLGIQPYIASVAPASTNVVGPSGTFKVGQLWVNSSANTVYQLTSFSASAGVISATWTSL